MEKVKIYDIAKKLDITSKEILQKAEELGIEAKSHLSSINESDAKKIEESLKKSLNKKEAKENKEAQNKKESKKEKNESPVIIRREVIISEEENKKKEEEQQKHTDEKRKNSVGFVERKQNDYNIVYRNKPSKQIGRAHV